MSEVVFRVERDDGEVFVIDDSTWRIPNDGLSGWHSTTTNVSVFNNTTSDGSIITAQQVPSTDRTISVEARDKSASAFLRTRAERFFIPHRNYTVIASYMGRTRKFTGVQAAFTLSEGNIHKPVSFAWTITCPSPYASDMEPAVGTSPYTKVLHGSGMPYRVFSSNVSGYRSGFVTGVSRQAPEPGFGINRDDVISITSNGDVRTRATFYLKAPKILRSSAGFKGAWLEVEINELREYADGDHSQYYYGNRRLYVYGIDWSYGGEDPAEEYLTRTVTDYAKIDMSARPFRIESIEVNEDGTIYQKKREQFRVRSDTFLRDPYIEQGESVFEVKARIRDSDGAVYPTSVDKYVTLENLYTGV